MCVFFRATNWQSLTYPIGSGESPHAASTTQKLTHCGPCGCQATGALLAELALCCRALGARLPTMCGGALLAELALCSRALGARLPTMSGTQLSNSFSAAREPNRGLEHKVGDRCISNVRRCTCRLTSRSRHSSPRTHPCKRARQMHQDRKRRMVFQGLSHSSP